jgi:hypothetical protein
MPFRNCGDGTLPLANTAAAALFTFVGVAEYTGDVYDVEQCELLPLLVELWYPALGDDMALPP